MFQNFTLQVGSLHLSWILFLVEHMYIIYVPNEIAKIVQISTVKILIDEIIKKSEISTLISSNIIK